MPRTQHPTCRLLDMTARKAANRAAKKAAKQKTTRQSPPASKRLAPREERRSLEAPEAQRGLDGGQMPPLIAEVERAVDAKRPGLEQVTARTSPDVDQGRFAGGAYDPVLRKRDRCPSKTPATSLRDRKGYAERLLALVATVASNE